MARRAAGDEGGECSRGVRRWSCCCSCFFFAVPCAHPVRDTRRWMETGNGMIWEGGGRWDLGGKSRECALVVLGPSGGSTEGGQWTCRGQAAAKSVLVLSASGQGCPKGRQGSLSNGSRPPLRRFGSGTKSTGFIFFFHGASFPNSSLDTANQLAWHIAKITGRRTMAVLCGRTGRTYLVPTSLPYF